MAFRTGGDGAGDGEWTTWSSHSQDEEEKGDSWEFWAEIYSDRTLRRKFSLKAQQDTRELHSLLEPYRAKQVLRKPKSCILYLGNLAPSTTAFEAQQIAEYFVKANVLDSLLLTPDMARITFFGYGEAEAARRDIDGLLFRKHILQADFEERNVFYKGPVKDPSSSTLREIFSDGDNLRLSSGSRVEEESIPLEEGSGAAPGIPDFKDQKSFGSDEEEWWDEESGEKGKEKVEEETQQSSVITEEIRRQEDGTLPTHPLLEDRRSVESPEEKTSLETHKRGCELQEDRAHPVVPDFHEQRSFCSEEDHWDETREEKREGAASPFPLHPSIGVSVSLDSDVDDGLSDELLVLERNIEALVRDNGPMDFRDAEMREVVGCGSAWVQEYVSEWPLGFARTLTSVTMYGPYLCLGQDQELVAKRLCRMRKEPHPFVEPWEPSPPSSVETFKELSRYLRGFVGHFKPVWILDSKVVMAFSVLSVVDGVGGRSAEKAWRVLSGWDAAETHCLLDTLYNEEHCFQMFGRGEIPS